MILANEDTTRILSLPHVAYTGDGVQEALQLPGGSLRLNAIQAQALEAIAREFGALLPIGVGRGKTWIALLAASAMGARAAVVLCPAAVVAQMERERRRLAEHFEMRPIQILGYEMLSRPQSSDALERLALMHADGGLVIVADEAHKLKALDSARTRRLMRVFEVAPQTQFVALSGTLTAKSLRDFAHLAWLALRERSPLPLKRTVLDAWAQCIDVDGRPGPDDWYHLRGLADVSGLGGEERKAAARQAFQARFHSAPGVVASLEGDLGQSLVIDPITELRAPGEIQKLMDAAAEGQDPNGDVLTEEVAVWRCRRQLSAGFWYRWDWPHGAVDYAWLFARRDWHRVVRDELSRRAGPGYDSPALVAAAVDEGRAGGPQARQIRAAWLAQSHKPAPPVVTEWCSDYLVQDAVRRAGKQSVILWYDSAAVADALWEAGIPVYGAGDAAPFEDPRGPVALSIRVHGTGVDGLQTWCDRMIVLEPPASGKTWEQLLGRLHRQGQPSDEVTVSVYAHTDAFKDALVKARQGARYIEDTTGNVQKLNIATFIEEI